VTPAGLTAEGLAEGTWWDERLGRYYHEAERLGLESETGRQALAKFVATACALLESVVRVHGWLPEPGVRLGENVDG